MLFIKMHEKILILIEYKSFFVFNLILIFYLLLKWRIKGNILVVWHNCWFIFCKGWGGELVQLVFWVWRSVCQEVCLFVLYGACHIHKAVPTEKYHWQVKYSLSIEWVVIVITKKCLTHLVERCFKTTDHLVVCGQPHSMCFHTVKYTLQIIYVTFIG